MLIWDYSLLSVVMIMNCGLLSQMALNGLMEISIQRPVNRAALETFFTGMILITIINFTYRYKYDVSMDVAKHVGTWPSMTMSLIIPCCWYLFYRFIWMPPGLREHNIARHRTRYWMIDHFEPGVRLAKGTTLANFSRAKSAVDLFRKAILLQSRTLDRASSKVSGLTWKTELSIAIIHLEFGLLYRMMNAFNDARRQFNQSLKIIEQVKAQHPEDRDCLYYQASAFYRLGELYHAQNEIGQARKLYKDSIGLYRLIGCEGDQESVERLLNQIGE